MLHRIDPRLEECDRDPGIRIVVADFSESRLTISSQGIEVGAELLPRFFEFHSGVVVMCLAPRDLEFGVCRMWREYAGVHRHQMRVVRRHEHLEQEIADLTGPARGDGTSGRKRWPRPLTLRPWRCSGNSVTTVGGPTTP